MSRGGKLSIPVKLIKQADFKDIAKAKIKLSASGLPGGKQKSVTGKDVTLEVKKPDGKMEVTFTEKAPVGTFTFIVRGEVTMPYKHDPGGRVKRTADDKKRIEELSKKIAEEAKQAAQALQKADQEEKAVQQAFAKKR